MSESFQGWREKQGCDVVIRKTSVTNTLNDNERHLFLLYLLYHPFREKSSRILTVFED